MILRPGFEVSDEQLAAPCRANHVRRLEVFGSVLRDDFRDESDIDLLVEFESGAEVGFLALGALRRQLEALMGRRVDLVPRGGLKPVIRESVLRAARTLYRAA
jgi:predicted nucleotidyltransferase